MRVDEFRDMLDEALRSTPQPLDDARHAIRRRVVRRRLRTRVAAASVVVVVLGVAVSILAWSRPGGSRAVSVNQRNGTTTVTTSAGATRPGWHRIPNPPFTHALAAVRTGRQVIVAFQPSRLRFAAFDPVARRWDKLPTPPLDLQAPFTDSPTFANTGGSIIVWGHDQTRPPDTYAGSMRIMEYRPATRTWLVLPDPPIHSLIQATPIWTGSELIVWGGNEVSIVASAFDPVLRRWHEIPGGPRLPREDPVVVWTGREMLVWGGFRLTNPPDPTEGAAFDPRTNTWRVLPPSGLSTRELAATAWTGRLFLVWGGSANAPQDPADGAAYDLATNSWHPIAPAPIAGREEAAVTWTGRRLFVWGGISFNRGRQTLRDGATYDPASNSWSVLPRSPLVSRWGAVTIWTGHEVLVVEGYGPSRRGAAGEPALPDAAIYLPGEES